MQAEFKRALIKIDYIFPSVYSCLLKKMFELQIDCA